jgi:hypothetical protein
MVRFLDILTWVMMAVCVVLLVISVLMICRGIKARRRLGNPQTPLAVPPVDAPAEEVVGGIVIGGLYASQNKDGTHSISKVLDVNFAVHVRLYRETFAELPRELASSQLTLGVGHAPMAGDRWLEKHLLVGRESVLEDELEGYRIYLEA